MAGWLAEKQMCCRHIRSLKLTHLFKAGNQMSKMHVTLSNKRPMWRRGPLANSCGRCCVGTQRVTKCLEFTKEQSFAPFTNLVLEITVTVHVYVNKPARCNRQTFAWNVTSYMEWMSGRPRIAAGKQGNISPNIMTWRENEAEHSSQMRNITVI